MNLQSLTVLLAAPFLLLLWAGRGPADPPLINVALLSAGTRVQADSQFSDRHAGSNAADSSVTPGEGCWYSRDQTPLPCALTFTLAGEEDLRRVVLHQARWTGNMYHTKDFALETSPDGRTWQRVATGLLADDSEARAIVELGVKTRFLRVVVLTSYNAFQTCGLAEVELLASRPLAVGGPDYRLDGRPVFAPSAACGMGVLAQEVGPQAAVWRDPAALLACVRPGERFDVGVPVYVRQGGFTAQADLAARGGTAEVTLETEKGPALHRLLPPGAAIRLQLSVPAAASQSNLWLRVTGRTGEAAVSVTGLRLTQGERAVPVRLAFAGTAAVDGPVPVTPNLRPALQQAMIEWDWKLQDGIGTERNPSRYPQAVARTLASGQRLVDDLLRKGLRARLGNRVARWESAAREARSLSARDASAVAWESLYLRLHRLRREIALSNPLAQVGPLLFAKQVPGCFSHQLTQYYGRYARPGGGLFVLDRPGVSMDCRPLLRQALPPGSYMHPEVSWDGRRVLFAYCRTDRAPTDTIQGQKGRYYHLYAVQASGEGLKPLTDGSFDDFSPRFLPDGRIVFISTRRGGWHRCGTPGCENYTLTLAGADGRNPRSISFHETQEWDPAVLNDGRLIYTRWDYVDRHPVFYEHLWTTFPDGTEPAAYYGNNTFNPVGIWEARPIPGSRRLMATAAAHHAMTAGSIVLLDVGRGVDGPAAIRRLTPDAPFPESETTVSGTWHAPMPGTKPYATPESERWPGHCYRSPYPLSEDYFLAAYSFEPLVGEPRANPPGMFGLYLADAFGNRELLYRDPRIASLWPIPLRPRKRPPVLPVRRDRVLGEDGVFVLQDVYAGLPSVPRGSIKALRILQVLPKSTPGKDLPPMGLASGAPGKQLLGTVPVEADGSAHFRLPAGKEVAFQALDSQGMAVQVMRSGTYLQRGERTVCVGCHERRATAPPGLRPLALRKPPARPRPGPDGSRPFSYPRLVQPVLDRRCVGCHSGAQPAGGARLTGEAEGHYTASYNALVTRVPFSDMNNTEALSSPGRYGARGSALMTKLLAGHHGVRLTPDEIERLALWMDASALFYGSFDPSDQARQQRGELIRGPRQE